MANSNIPADLKYTADHEWLRLSADGKTATVGITDFAQSELGELTFIEIDTVGKSLNAHDIFGTVETVKATSELFIPVAAKVLEMNPELDDSASGAALINEDPYGRGWIVRIEVLNASELGGLLDAAGYAGTIG